jgi:hypothetical protein
MEVRVMAMVVGMIRLTGLRLVTVLLVAGLGVCLITAMAVAMLMVQMPMGITKGMGKLVMAEVMEVEGKLNNSDFEEGRETTMWWSYL